MRLRIRPQDFYASDFAQTGFVPMLEIGLFGNPERLYDLMQSQSVLPKNKLSTIFMQKKKPSVFDVGIGAGHSVRAFMKAGYNVSGVDGSHVMIKKCLEAGIPCHRHPVNFEADPLPVATATQDVVISNQTLYFINDLRHVFSESARIAKPGAIFAFNIAPSQTEYTQFHSHDVTNADQGYLDGTYIETYSHPAGEVESICRNNGFYSIYKGHPYEGYKRYDGTTQIFQDFICVKKETPKNGCVIN